MGEEKKVSKNSKKLVYEVPRLVRLVDEAGLGSCYDGSGDGSTCDTGYGALGAGCSGGSAPNPT